MNPYTTETEVGLSLACTTLIQRVYDRVKPPALAKELLLVGNRQIEVISQGNIGAIPWSFWLFDGTSFGAAIFQGIDPSCGPAYVAGLGSLSESPTNHGVHSGVWAGFQQPAISTLCDRLADCQLQLLSGHSLGGAVALSLASLMGPTRRLSQRGVITFGSPRCFHGGAPTLAWCQKVIRWAAPGDSIVLFPPRAGENLPGSAVIAGIVGSWPADFYNPGPVRVYDDHGAFRLNNIFWNLLPFNTIDVSAFAAGLPSSLSARHSLSRYSALGGRLVDDNVPFWGPQKPEVPAESMSLPILTQVEVAARVAAGFPVSLPMRCQHAVAVREERHESSSSPPQL